jgi:hypothetical protein
LYQIDPFGSRVGRLQPLVIAPQVDEAEVGTVLGMKLAGERIEATADMPFGVEPITETRQGLLSPGY